MVKSIFSRLSSLGSRSKYVQLHDLFPSYFKLRNNQFLTDNIDVHSSLTNH